MEIRNLDTKVALTILSVMDIVILAITALF